MAVEQGAECPVCGDRGGVLRARQAQYAYLKCPACGSCFLHPLPSPESLAEFYERFHDPVLGAFSDFESRMARDLPAKLDLVQSALPPPVSLLDVGCGRGDFVRLCQRSGYDARGIDISATAVSKAKARGLACRAGKLVEQDDWHSAFDGVTCFATLEHVPRPAEFLLGINRVLKAGGHLFLDTGLAGDLTERLAPGFLQWFDAPQHIFVFSRCGLQHLLEQAGFVIEHVDCCFDRSFLRRAVRATRNVGLSVFLSALLGAALGRAAFSRMKQEAKLPYGNLIMVVARKPPA